MKYKPIIFLTIILLLLCGIVNAAPPTELFESTGNIGIHIEHPFFEYVEMGKDIDFHFHLFNDSNGLPITNTTPLSCYFHLYNRSGNHIYKRNNFNEMDFPLDFEVEVGGENFTKLGNYQWIMQCNSSNSGGFVTSQVSVTYDGFAQTEKISFNLPIMLFLLSLIIISLFFAYTTEHWSVRVGASLMSFVMVIVSFQFVLNIIGTQTIEDIKSMFLTQYQIYITGFWLFLILCVLFVGYSVLKMFSGSTEQGKRKQKEEEFRW